MADINLNNIQHYHSAVEGYADDNITAGSYGSPFACWTAVNYIANDSDTYAMKVNFDKTIGSSGTFTLLPGEVLSDLRIQCKQIYLQGIGGRVPFRALGA